MIFNKYKRQIEELKETIKSLQDLKYCIGDTVYSYQPESTIFEERYHKGVIKEIVIDEYRCCYNILWDDLGEWRSGGKTISDTKEGAKEVYKEDKIQNLKNDISSKQRQLDYLIL